MIALVLVSHSAALAEGIAELASQMAPDVTIVAAGGTDDGEIGTSFDKTLAAVDQAGPEAVILYDLGSAKMTAELVLETLDEEQQEKVALAEAPLVEGAVAAAVAAQGGADLATVVAAAQSIRTAAAATSPLEPSPNAETVSETLTLINPLGLHARPAAALARLLPPTNTAAIGAVGGPSVDLRSVLAVVQLGLRGGAAIQLTVSGPDATTILTTMSAAITTGFGELDQSATGPVPSEPVDTSDGFKGVPAVPGLAIGELRLLTQLEPIVPIEQAENPAAARQELAAAIAATTNEFAADTTTTGTAAVDTGQDGIIQAHQAMLADPMLRDAAFAGIDDGLTAASAWWRAVQDAKAQLTAATDPLVRERGIDVADVGIRVLRRLRPDLVVEPTIAGEPTGTIVLAADLVPSAVPQLAAAGVAGFALNHGGITSHTVVVARGLNIPTVVGLGVDLDRISGGETAILDGTSGTLNVAPTDAELALAAAQRQEWRAEQAAALATATAPVVIADGRRIDVAANIASVADATAAVEIGADGVGLLRTELLFLDRTQLPTEDEQVAVLAEIFRILQSRPVVVRTLDVGGDKQMPALQLDSQRNGFLGERGLRYGLAHPQTLRTQLRAILRAAHSFRGRLGLMAPMVTVATEAIAFRTAIEAAATELADAGVNYALPTEVGVMVEVPAAVLAATELCAAVDFVSIGSNDLVQYIMAAERTNETVAHLYQPDHPAIWRAIELLTGAAKQAGCRVAVCGEMAANPEFAARLVRLGVTELSMAPAAIPRVKAALRSG